jgi:hypothetical protein
VEICGVLKGVIAGEWLGFWVENECMKGCAKLEIVVVVEG